MESENDNEVKIDIETSLSKEKRLECRQIVKEIREFGVNQRQLLYLIQLLALELENREVMLEVTEAIKGNRNKIAVEPVIQIASDVD